jgi:glycosyltransferase involved in cell wall biosynthesis
VSRPALGLSIPLFNEAAVAVDFAMELRDVLRTAKIPSAIVLVNNGSTDGTGKLINQLAAKDESFLCLHMEENLGYGGGILAGMRQLQTPILGWAWGDGQVAADVVVAAYSKLVESGASLAKARRVERQDGWQRRIISRSYNLGLRAMGVGIADTNGCPKLFNREAWEAIAPRSTDWFLDPEVVLRAKELGLEWAEVEAVMQARRGGVSKVHRETVVEFLRHLKEWRGGWRP